MIGEQKIGIAQDGGEHVVEIMRHAPGELADRLHLLSLDETLLQVALLGRLERENVGRPALSRRDEHLYRALRGSREARIDRGNVTLSRHGRRDGGAHRLQITLRDVGVERMATRRRSPAFSEQARERCVRAGDRAVGVERGDGHGGGVEEARKAHLRGAQIVGRLLAVGPFDHQGSGRTRHAIGRERDPVQHANRNVDAVAALQVDVELFGLHVAGASRDHAEQRRPVSYHDIGCGESA